jgi:hypothetical protein
MNITVLVPEKYVDDEILFLIQPHEERTNNPVIHDAVDIVREEKIRGDKTHSSLISRYSSLMMCLTLLLFVTVGLSAQRSIMSKYIEQIDSISIRRTLSVLASDEFEGRGTAQSGGDRAQQYIVDYLDSCGVTPAIDTSYFQDIKCIKISNPARKHFTVNGVNFPNDYRYENPYRSDTFVDINEITVVVLAADDSLKGIDIKDKTIMKLEHSRDEYLDAHSPKTVINVSFDFEPLLAKAPDRIYFTPLPTNAKRYNQINISTRLANKLLASTGKSISDLIAEVERSGQSQIFTLKISVQIHGNITYRHMNVNNIVGIIEGSDLKDEYIVLSAHHDHNGIANGKIFNGADDNASGVSSVLEVARILAKAKTSGNGTRRSVIILLPAAEELGLIGSRYYTVNPLFPLDRTRACVNVDMVGRIDDRHKATNGAYIYIVNDVLSKIILDNAKRANIDRIILNTKDLNSLFRRSDHYNFSRHDIPAVLLTSGLHNDYHTPNDDTDRINFNAMWLRNRFLFALIWKLANE